jgi:RimJ/RimL family protein N-acetyltransferase
MLNNLSISGLNTGTEPFCGAYYGLFSGTSLTAVLVQYWNGILMAQGCADGVEAILQANFDHLSDVKGFIGAQTLCARMKTYYEYRRGAKPLAMNAEERLYALALSELRSPEQLTAGVTRVSFVKPEQTECLTQWMIDYEVTSLNSKRSPALAKTAAQQLQARINAGTVFVLVDGTNTPLSTCSFNAQYGHYVQIGAVWTPPELRSRGYAKAVTAGALALAARQGHTEAILFTQADNNTAIGAYEAIGFKHCGAFGLYLYQQD